MDAARASRQEDDYFYLEIMRDLTSQGFSGDELNEKHLVQRENIRQAIGVLLNEAGAIASGKRESATTKDIFGED